MGTHDHPEGGAPLSSASFHILVALSGGTRHGYGIMQEVAALTDGKVQLGPGTLYRSIKALLADGLIEETNEDLDPVPGDDRRRYCRLTQRGRGVAEAEAARLAALVRVARSRHLLPEMS